jgi:hypothetical protein
VLLDKHYCGDKLKANEMGGRCGMHARQDKCTKGMAKKLSKLEGLEDLVVDGRIILQ